jgi:hypothetical protein
MSKRRRTNSDLLAELRAYVSYESADFSNIYARDSDPLPTDEKHVTEFIRRRTKLYRETWIGPVIDELSKRLKVKP